MVAEANKKLETLVRLYYLRHGFEAMDLFLVVPLMYIGFECHEAINDTTPPHELESLRSTLVLVAHGLYSQRRNHYLAQALYLVIRDRMRPQERTLLRGCANIDDKDEDDVQELTQAVRSNWPVSVVTRQKDPESHVLANLVGKFISSEDVV